MFLLRSAGYCLVMCVRSEGGKGEIEGSLNNIYFNIRSQCNHLIFASLEFSVKFSS